MTTNERTLAWLLDSDPSLRWQVERDLIHSPAAHWESTRLLTSTQGFGIKLLNLQDSDGQWAGGAFFPAREEPRAVIRAGEEGAQPFIATTWSLNALREWGVDAEALGDTADKLAANARWEFDDLPYWDGEVDCCINSFTLANGAWLGVNVEANGRWFLEHQLEDGGWNCEWFEGSTRSSFHSTLNSLKGLLEYEQRTGRRDEITQARWRGEEYLLERELMFKLSTGEVVGGWTTQFTYPSRWRYSTLRALNYFKHATEFDSLQIDIRLEKAIETVRRATNERGRWINQCQESGSVWFEVDGLVGEESKWVTFQALRVLKWWDSNVDSNCH